MKKPSLFVPFVILSIFLQCCAHPKRNVVNPENYSLSMRAVEHNGNPVSLNESRVFWETRSQHSTADYTALLKLSGVHAELFKHSGDIQDLLVSDSLLFVVMRNSKTDQCSAYQALAVNAMTRHEFWQAKKYITQALTIGQNKAVSLFTLADIELELGNIDEARKILNSFTNKNSFAWLVRESKILDHDGDLNSAIGLMEKAASKVENNRGLYCWTKSNLADMYGHAGKIEKAYHTYLDALAHDPAYFYALKGIAWIAFSNDHNPAEAKRILNFLSAKNPSPEYLLLKSKIAEWENDKASQRLLLRAFQQQTTQHTTDAMYNRYLTFVDLDLDRIPDAVKRAKLETEIRPTPASFALLAWALFQNGEDVEALRIVQDRVEGQTQEPEVLYQMGTIYLSQGDTNKGKDYLATALQSNFELGPVISERIRIALSTL